MATWQFWTLFGVQIFVDINVIAVLMLIHWELKETKDWTRMIANKR